MYGSTVSNGEDIWVFYTSRRLDLSLHLAPPECTQSFWGSPRGSTRVLLEHLESFHSPGFLSFIVCISSKKSGKQ